MGETSKIAWTDATINFWMGCTKVSPACDHCYAEAWGKRSGMVKWGAGQPRRKSKSAIKTAFKLERQAIREGRRIRVFTNSLADFFDKEVPEVWRDEAMAVIALTPHLDWLVLTKRQKVMSDYLAFGSTYQDRCNAIGEQVLNLSDDYVLLSHALPLRNMRLGVTVESQDMAELRLPALKNMAGQGWKTFVSYEPALGPVKWWPFLDPEGLFGGCIQWVIVGGESGHHARTFDLQWARDTRDACKRAGVPFFMKQLGTAASDPHNGLAGKGLKVPAEAAPLIGRRLADPAGADPAEWPADLRIQQFPEAA